MLSSLNKNWLKKWIKTKHRNVAAYLNLQTTIIHYYQLTNWPNKESKSGYKIFEFYISDVRLM